MGNFEKLSVLVIVVIIVMILVVALYTWTDKPADQATTAGLNARGTSAAGEAGAGIQIHGVAGDGVAGNGVAGGGSASGRDPVPNNSLLPSDPSVDPKFGNGVEIAILPDSQPLVGPGPAIGNNDLDPVVPIAPEPGPSEPWVYVVQKGDVFSTICNRELDGYYKHLSALKMLNPGMDFNRISIGQRITMPPRGGAENAVTPAARGNGTAGGSASGGQPGGEWVVKSGESLKDIAKTVYGDWKAWIRIFATNSDQIRDPSYPAPGTRLKLPLR